MEKQNDTRTSRLASSLCLQHHAHSAETESAWWLDADVVYASSICLPDGAMAELAGRMKLVRPGTVVITLKMLPGGAAPEFEVVHAGWYRMSWGRTGVWILRRTKYVS